jgi:hypothetical protein
MPVVETKPDAEVPAAAPEKEAEQPGESATPATEETQEVSEQSGEPAKRESRGVQKALDRLTAEREAERQLRLAAEEREKSLLKALETKTPVPEPVVEDTEPQWPNRVDYPDDVSWQGAVQQFTNDRIDWSARKAVEEDRKQQEEVRSRQQQEEAARAAMVAHGERLAQAREKYADFSETLDGSDVVLTSEVLSNVLRFDENGAEFAYYLAKHPEEAKRIDALPIPKQLMELGKIAAKLEVAPPPAPEPAKEPALTRAPPPIKPTRASSETPPKDPNSMSMEEYAAHYKKREEAKRVTRH